MKPEFFKITHRVKQAVKPITSLASKDVSNNLHPEGLFSTEIFGNAGSPERMYKFSYIPLHTSVISPHLYAEMAKLSAFYNEIMLGKAFATWNDKIKGFERSDYEHGDTGYSFFLSHMNDIKWSRTGSAKRDQKIAMIEKYKDVMELEDYFVIPAGLRDLIVKDGKDTEDEINPLYRKLLGLASLLEGVDGKHKNADGVRVKLQATIQEIYKHIMTVADGKNGFIQGKWTKSNIVAGTRNVITASTIKIKDYRKDNGLGLNDSIVGLYQYAYGIYSKLDFLLRAPYIERVLGDGSAPNTSLVNLKTGKFELVNTPAKDVAKFMTVDGLEMNIIRKLKTLTYTHNPIKVGKYGLMNIYDDGKIVRPMFDNNVPEGFDAKHIRPMSYIDLISLAVLEQAKDAVGLMTRYPIAAQGSIYPTNLFVKTTIDIREVTVLDDNWNPKEKLNNFPIINSQIFTSMAVHHSKLHNLNGDHDGDKLSLTILLTKEAIAEIKALMRSTVFLIRPNGKWVNPIDNDITSHVLKHITRGLKK